MVSTLTGHPRSSTPVELDLHHRELLTLGPLLIGGNSLQQPSDLVLTCITHR